MCERHSGAYKCSACVLIDGDSLQASDGDVVHWTIQYYSNPFNVICLLKMYSLTLTMHVTALNICFIAFSTLGLISGVECHLGCYKRQGRKLFKPWPKLL